VNLYNQPHLKYFPITIIIVFLLLSPVGFLYFTASSQKITPADIVLVTGFEPFDIYEINPSELIALHLHDTLSSNYLIKGHVLPVDYAVAPAMMKSYIQEYDPVLIIASGLAPKATTIRVETLAYNLRINPEEPYPLLTLKRVNNSGPWIQKTNFNVEATVQAIQEKDIAVEQSYFPGFYLCNAILYEMLFYQQTIYETTPTGFIHLPLLDSQDPNGMSLDTMIQTIHAIIEQYAQQGT